MKVIVEEIKNSDESFSKSGLKDFIQPEGEVKTLVNKVPVGRARTLKSLVNSYT